MFNTLLRQLRLSIDYALTGSYDVAMSLGTKIIKEHEERMFQEAVIKTIGGTGGRGLEAGGALGGRGRGQPPPPPGPRRPGALGRSSAQTVFLADVGEDGISHRRPQLSDWPEPGLRESTGRGPRVARAGLPVTG